MAEKKTYTVLHQGHVYRTTRSRPVGFALFRHNEHSLLVDELVTWTKTEKGAQRVIDGSLNRSDIRVVPVREVE